MLPARIMNATRYLGAPAGWDPERDPPCSHLAIRDEVHDGMPMMVSAWEPTPDEIARLQAGAKVVLHIVGVGHPPVAVEVGDAPE